MRSIIICIMIMAMGCSLVFAGGKKTDDGFKAYYQNFKKAAQEAIQKKDEKKISALMVDNFQWASDSQKITKKAVLQNMHDYGIWDDLQSAIGTKPAQFEDSSCENGECYSIWSQKRVAGFVFRKINGQWRWVEFRAD